MCVYLCEFVCVCVLGGGGGGGRGAITFNEKSLMTADPPFFIKGSSLCDVTCCACVGNVT